MTTLSNQAAALWRLFASQDANIDGFLMEKLRSDVHGRLESVVKDEETAGGQSGTYTRAQVTLYLRRPANGYLASQAVTGVIKYTGTRMRLGSEICI